MGMLDSPGPPGNPLSEAARQIEDFFRRRYGREALYVPSGRLALYIAFREWLRPGDRVLMSPVDDDVVFFTVLAAGLLPTVGPVDPRTGNIDPTAVDDKTWARVRAVLTTNLYGVPDRMGELEDLARRHGFLLLEDAAHALDSSVDGQRIGTFGTAAAFSLSKHLGIAGGVLCFSEEGRRDALARRATSELRSPMRSKATLHRWSALLSTAGGPSRVPRWLARLAPRSETRAGHRMSYTVPEVREAQARGGGLDPFDRWVRMDHPAYRTWPLRSAIRISLRRLEAFDDNRRLCIEGARRLFELGYTPPGLERPRDTALLRVPLFVQNREAVIAHLARHGLGTEYIYDPPLDLYAPMMTESLPSPPAARAWSRDVLPVNPLLADRFLDIVRGSPGLLRPSLVAI